MRTLILCVPFLYYSSTMLAQDIPVAQKQSQEHLRDLQNDQIRNEVALFTINGSSIRDSSSVSKIKLTEIPLKRCSDKYLHFEKGNLYAAEIIINITANEEAQQPGIKKIMYIHYKYGFSLPDSAIADITNPKFCEKFTSKGKPLASNCKVFQSADKRRLYIYMLNGEGTSSYEVTWVVQNSKYLTRIVDPIGGRLMH